MDASIDRLFLDFSTRKLAQLLGRITDCVDQLTEEQVWTRGAETENAVGNLMLHLSGNVRQWIVSGLGGKPDTRVRDGEFAARGDVPKAELRERLEASVQEGIAVIRDVTPEQLTQTLMVQSYPVSGMEAIYHVVEHFAQHTGQIVFATKLFTGKDLGFYRHLSRPATHAEKTP